MSIEVVVEEIMRIHRSLPTRPGVEEVEAAKALIKNVDKEDQSRIEAISRQIKAKNVPDELFKILQEIQKNMVYLQGKEQKREAVKLLDLENVHSVFDDLIQRASKCLSPSASAQSNANNESLSYSTSYSRDSSTMSLSTSASFSGNSFSSPANTTSMGTNTTMTSSSLSTFYNEKVAVKASELFSKDDTYLKKAKATFHEDGMGVGWRSGDFSTTPHIVDSTLKPAINSGMSGFVVCVEIYYV